MNKIIKGETYRFTVITDSLIRIEQDNNGIFEDHPTTAVLHRNFEKVNAEILKNHNNHIVEIITDAFHLYYDGGAFAPDTLYADIKVSQALHVSRWHFGTENAEGTNNLKGTARTLDRAEGDVREWLENGLLSRVGWAVIDEREPRKDGSLSLMFERDTNGGMDWVLFPGIPHLFDPVHIECNL